MKLTIAITFTWLSAFSYGHEIVESKQDLFSLMNHVSINELQLTPEEAIERSDFIVIGKIVSITDGRSIQRNIKTTARPTKTAVIKVEVSKILKGSVGDYVYLEYIRGGIPAEYLDQHKYQDEMLLLLRDTKHMWPPGDYTFTNSPNGLMAEVDTLYVLTTQRGLIIAPSDDPKAGTLYQPLDQTDAPLFKGSTLIDAENYMNYTTEDIGKMLSPNAKKPKSNDLKNNH